MVIVVNVCQYMYIYMNIFVIMYSDILCVYTTILALHEHMYICVYKTKFAGNINIHIYIYIHVYLSVYVYTRHCTLPDLLYNTALPIDCLFIFGGGDRGTAF